MLYGLIGEKLGHSYSCEIHEKIADYHYELREIPREELADFFAKRDFKGINVTIPYKEAVMPLLDEISDTAKAVGAVNTVVNRGGRLYGYNTDLAGMTAMLRRAGIDPSGKKALVLGTGGTSKTARAVLKSLGAASITLVSRSGREGGVTYDEAAVKCADAEIIINTTPVGMYPNIGAKPIDISLFPRLCGVADAIYNPLRSELISDAAERGIPCSGGLYMLAAQAVYARALFLGEEADESLIGKAYLGTKLQKQNIVLIGMPSSGKSTVGGLLAESDGREFIDTDLLIAERACKSIPEIFAAEGESGFRKLESEVIADVAAKSGCVIATGGGSVLNPANVRKLKQNGVLVFLDRRPELLCGTADRPLSQNSEAMARLYEQRYPIYTASADITVDSNGTVSEAAELIKKELQK